MTKESLSEALKLASSSRAKDGTFSFEPAQNTTVLLTAESSVMTIDRVTRVSVKAGVVVIDTERRERLFVASEFIVGLRQQATSESPSGFLPGA